MQNAVGSAKHTLKLQGLRIMRALLLIVVILMLIGVLPLWPHSIHWGYFPSGGLGTVLVVVLVLMFVGVI